MTAADGTLDAVGVGNFAVRARTYAQIITELPVVQIMAALHGGFRKSRCFVVNKTRTLQRAVYCVFDIQRRFVLRQTFRRRMTKRRIRLHRQMIRADVGRARGDGSLHVVQGRLNGLVRQGIHQVDIDFIK